jgi:hypothetical protein
MSAFLYLVGFLMVAIIAFGLLDSLLRALLSDEEMERWLDRIFR